MSIDEKADITGADIVQLRMKILEITEQQGLAFRLMRENHVLEQAMINLGNNWRELERSCRDCGAITYEDRTRRMTVDYGFKLSPEQRIMYVAADGRADELLGALKGASKKYSD